MSFFIVDVEADGPVPGLYSMVNFGVVRIDGKAVKAGLSLEDCIRDTYYGELAPISEKWIPDALAISGFSRADHLRMDPALEVMPRFEKWLRSVNTGKAVFLSDNPAFDWQFINYYFALAELRNPFGHSARRIGDVYSGIKKNLFASSEWKRLRETRHTHNPVDDAKGNAEAFIKMCRENKMRIPD